MSLAEALGLSTPTDELAGEELRERLAYLLGQAERLVGAGVVLTLAEWARWPQVEQELWLSAGDRVRRATAALHGTASGGGVAEVLAPIDGGESMLRRHLEARADRVEELARGGGVVARAEPARPRPVALRSGLAPDLFRLGV